MSKIFLSHASADKDEVSLVAAALASCGVQTWVSFRDIKPGSHWEESIEIALTAAPALVVIVTPASVESRYVRSEVQEAIRRNKTVIPLIVQDAPLPLRWRALQCVFWNPNDMAISAQTVAAGLPTPAVTSLRAALEDPSRFADVRRLILSHPEWLPMEYAMAHTYTIKVDVPIEPAFMVDCFAARLDTPGPRAILYYLASPYRSPFSRSASPELLKIADKIRRHSIALTSRLPDDHVVVPPKLFEAESHNWHYILPRYTRLNCNIVVGRRKHFRGLAAGVNRDLFRKHVGESIFGNPSFDGNIEIMTYDRLLDGLQDV
jgi:hypothetical protein